ncbi:hypothetical protein [Paractinoplanes maris]|uniref:hypothetical protein n=1 Tax=Paractinoplanes maris TaxID=1734446 RepID=UPI002021B820|nr:hypothetical protein [Actinoplanes maris]
MHVELFKPNALGKHWQARVDGGDAFKLLDLALQTDDDGNATLNLVLPVESLTIGDPSLGARSPQVRPAAPEQPAPSVWGASGKPDPRESIPGWQPEPDERTVDPRLVMEPGLGDRLVDSVRNMVSLRTMGRLA